MIKSCEYCGERLVRKRRADGRLESPRQFAARRHCGGTCANRGRHGVSFRASRVKRGPVNVEPVSVTDAPSVLLAAALWFHPDLITAFEEVDAGISVDSWEAYSNASPRERAA